MFRKNTAGQFVHFSMISVTNGSPVTGITPTVRRCIDGTFAAGDGTVTEDTGLGFYKYAMSQADTNGNNIGFRFIGTGAIDTVVNIVTTAGNPTDSVRFGLTALPNAAADAAGGLVISDDGGFDIDSLKEAAHLAAAADALLNRDMSTGTDSGSTTVRTPRQALRMLRNKVSRSGTTLTVTKEDDSTASFTATLTTDANAEPITAIDPAGP